MEGIITQNLLAKLHQIAQTHFTGELVIRAGSTESWKLYFLLGRLIWVNGGAHRFRRWHRLLTKHCPDIDPQSIRAKQNSLTEFWEYLVLLGLIKREKMTREQAIALVHDSIEEVLFDAMQKGMSVIQSEQSAKQIKQLDNSLVLIDGIQAVHRVKITWTAWSEAGLANCSPNLAPILRDPDRVKQQIPRRVHQALANLATGNTTLREMVLILNVDILKFSRALIPLVRKKIIELQEVDDWVPAQTKSSELQKSTITVSGQASSTLPLIMCIDDSPGICSLLERIFTQFGYRFISVQDPVQALPALLEAKPDLIFLDLVMPVASGYEICAQIRRTSMFKDTPVVIITGKDGIVDRVRAKVVGASGFIAKPLEVSKVIDVTRRYLGAMAPVESPEQQNFQSMTMQQTMMTTG
ncbi:MAG: response regulator [Leptolyngbyaceae bacterium]|nr:response regulator [Leptolyngbyaceae bacterium]